MSLFHLPQDQGWKSHVLVTLGLVTAAMATSMATDCLGVVLELNVCIFGAKWVHFNIWWIFGGKLIHFNIWGKMDTF